MSRARPPLPRPCGSCPYRRDVPSGVWAPEEYDKLPPYDAETGYQPAGLFMCHQQDGRVCAGWAGCHDMGQSLAVRLALLQDPELGERLLDYECEVPLWRSGREAAAHGLERVRRPDQRAVSAIQKLERRRDRRRA